MSPTGLCLSRPLGDDSVRGGSLTVRRFVTNGRPGRLASRPGRSACPTVDDGDDVTADWLVMTAPATRTIS